MEKIATKLTKRVAEFVNEQKLSDFWLVEKRDYDCFFHYPPINRSNIYISLINREYIEVTEQDFIDTLTRELNLLDKVEEVTIEHTQDNVVDDVINKFKERSELGIKKYDTTLESNTEGVLAFLNHLQEELIDATLYIQKLKVEVAEIKNKL